MTKPSAQIGFIKYVLLPLFEALSKVTYFYIFYASTLVSQPLLVCCSPDVIPQLYPEVEQIALEHLRLALTHYERKSEVTLTSSTPVHLISSPSYRLT